MRRRLFRPAAVIVLSGGMVLGTALPAFAHHPELSGAVACTNGQQIITWTIKNSESTTGSNRTMVVDQISVSSGTVVGVAVGAVFPPKPKSGSVKTATTTLSGTKTGTVTLTVRGDWIGGSQNVVRTTSVTLPGQCTVPTTTTTSTTTTSSTTTTTTTVPPSSTTTTTTVPPSSTTTTTTVPPSSTTTTTTVPPSSTTTTTVPTSSTTTTTLAPTSTTSPTVLGTTLTRDDGPQVLGETATKPAGGSLAHTGAALGMLVFVGGSLLWLGVPLSRYKRRNDDDEA